MREQIIYSWERLPVYEFTNEFARLLGRLLVSVPPRFHIQIHNLIGQTVAMTNAVPGAHRDLAPGEDPVPIEERRAWLTIGVCAAGVARNLLTELGDALKGSQKEVTAGLKLLAAIESSYQESLGALNGPPSQVPHC